jgi:hypothetical protein
MHAYKFAVPRRPPQIEAAIRARSRASGARARAWIVSYRARARNNSYSCTVRTNKELLCVRSQQLPLARPALRC